MNGQLGIRTLSIKEGSRASIYTPDRWQIGYKENDDYVVIR